MIVTPRAHEVDHELGRERPGSRSASRRCPARCAKICLVRVERPVARHVAVADGLAVLRRGGRARVGRRGAPTRATAAASRRSASSRCTRPPPSERRRRRRVEVGGERRGRVVDRAARLDEPERRRAARWRSGRTSALAVGQPARRSRPGSWPTCSRRATSPAREERAEVGEPRVRPASASPCDTSSRTSSRREPARLRRFVRLVRRRRAGSRARRSSSDGGHGCLDPARRARALRTDRSGGPPSMSATSPGTLAAGSRSVGDVLAGERVLVHLGAHVAGIDDEHAHVGMLGREHGRQLLERGLRRAVAAPPFVRLDRGVGRDVHDRAVRRDERRQRAAASSASGATTLTSKTCAEHVEVDDVERGQRAARPTCSRC